MRAVTLIEKRIEACLREVGDLVEIDLLWAERMQDMGLLKAPKGKYRIVALIKAEDPGYRIKHQDKGIVITVPYYGIKGIKK